MFRIADPVTATQIWGGTKTRYLPSPTPHCAPSPTH